MVAGLTKFAHVGESREAHLGISAVVRHALRRSTFVSARPWQLPKECPYPLVLLIKIRQRTP